tara:strand:+ start:198 stop:437 length:240 start_codon:yes stop_codon:yes gene_type:complete
LGQEFYFSVFLFFCFSKMQKITYPTKTLAQGCEYKPAAHTDIQCTWRKFGWMPLAELVANDEVKRTVKRAKSPKEVSHA